MPGSGWSGKLTDLTDRSLTMRPALSALLFFLLAPLFASAQTGPGSSRARFEAEAKPFLSQYCLKCHSTAKLEGEFDLERLAAASKVGLDPSAWRRVAEQLDAGEMPPASSKQPEKIKKEQFRRWVATLLDDLARERAGDPGRVVLRRLDNASYSYSLRDLLGVDLKPARQFPADGAAGEGFSNAGNALAMSPALMDRYLDAANDVASHAVMLPDGIRFSPSAMRQDWANELLAGIRRIYAAHSTSEGASQVNLQGIVFQTNDGGRLPVRQYLDLLLDHRRTKGSSLSDLARQRNLNPKYAGMLLQALDGTQPSWLLDQVRGTWRDAKATDAQAIAGLIVPWQQALTRFQSVGHMKPWMVPPQFTTLKNEAPADKENTASWRTMATVGGFPATAGRQDLRLEIPNGAPGATIPLYLAAGDAGDGVAGDVLVWENARLTIPGQKPVPLGELRAFAEERIARRERLLALTPQALAAAAEALNSTATVNLPALAKKHAIDDPSLQAWFGYLGLASGASPALKYMTNKVANGGGHAAVSGWSTGDLPNLMANSSNETVRVPGVLKAHGICVHPTPDRAVCVSWKSPINGKVDITGAVKHAHPECGNGVTWSLEIIRGGSRQRLAGGVAQGGPTQTVGPVSGLSIRQGDLLTLAIGPRDGNHSCDLTDLELNLSGPDGKKWSLTGDVANTVQAGNPHADSLGNQAVWHFHSEALAPGADGGLSIPPGSILAQWQTAGTPQERIKLAAALAQLLRGPAPTDAKSPNALLFARMTALAGPLVGAAPPAPVDAQRLATSRWGVNPSTLGGDAPAGAFTLRAPATVLVTIPADLGQGMVFESTVYLHGTLGSGGSAQAKAAINDAAPLTGARPDRPVLVQPGTPKARLVEEGLAAFRNLFPAALCYTKIVPVDEVVTLELFHREDEPLCRLMLSATEKAELDRLWRELHFVIRDKLTQVDAYNQLMEYATQDSDPKLFEHLRKPIADAALAFRAELKQAESAQEIAVLALAEKAYRRPLTADEKGSLVTLHTRLRASGIEADAAIRMLLVRVLASPHFIYRLERAPGGDKAATVNGQEQATRLAYFLWSSLPDDTLRQAAREGRLSSPADISLQAARMLRDPRAERLAREFACQWLHVYGFATMDEKSERHFPTFAKLKDDMEEEVVRYFTDLFRNDGSVLDILVGDRVWVNEELAAHYGIPGIKGPEWRAVDGARNHGRGGILTMAATLAKQSGASRTSPILRGNWVSEVLLGERLPRPPKDVPRLPEDEAATEGKTMRDLVQQHSSDPRCAVCHVRIDPFGFSLEGYDAIGRVRTRDLGDRPIDTKTTVRDGTKIEGAEGLERYLAVDKREVFLRQFCKKLLGYALGREIQVADEPTLLAMRQALEKESFKFSAAVRVVVESPQFRSIRGATATDEP